jgi:phenylacetate-coenzyme A ligase PaaK-like adenylate-forming protein
VDDSTGTVGGPRKIYERLRAAHLGAVGAAMEDHIGRLDWPRHQIERHQTQRLRSLFAYARERSPFHAQRLAGINPSQATVADLALLPMMTKQDAQERWDTIVTSPDLDRRRAEQVLAQQQWFSYTAADQQIFSSGGSSGVRGIYAWDWQFFITAACLAWRMQAREERRRPPPGPARLAVLEAGVPPHASTPLFDVPTTASMQTIVIEAGAPFDEVLDFVAAAQPTHLVGYPSVIARLARAALAGTLTIRPVRVSTNSEPLLEDDRQVIRQAWDCSLHNLWGSNEIGVQAVSCSHGPGLHVCEDEVILERVDDSGTPVGPHEHATRTLVTGLANRTFPFIRYDLGDHVTYLPGECACRSAYARVADIEGRRDDDFRYGTTVVPPLAFRHVLGTDPSISEYQVTQTAHGADILVVGRPDTTSLTSALNDALTHYGLADPHVRIHAVEQLPRHQASGKLRRFIPLR